MTGTDAGTWATASAAWVRWMQAAALSPGTIRLRRHHLGALARERGGSPWDVTDDELTDWLASHRTWAVETRRAARGAVRSFYGWATRTGRLVRDPAAGMPPITPPRPVARPTPEDVLASALRAAAPRERLMLSLGAAAGLRRAEIAAVHIDDLTRDPAGWTLLVHGKGRRQRRVPLPGGLARDLREACLAGGGHAFPGPDGHLSADHVGRLLARALPEHWTAHTLRHRFATAAWRGTGDWGAVQDLLGHAHLDTTRRYVAHGDDERRRAAAAAALPAA